MHTSATQLHTLTSGSCSAAKGKPVNGSASTTPTPNNPDSTETG